MIQRVQSIFLIAIIGCMITALVTPLVQLQVGQEIIDMTAISTTQNGETLIQSFWVGIVILANAIIAGLSIFQYKNRLLQIKLGALISFLSAGAVGLILLLKGDYPARFGIGIWAIMVALIFNFLANWFIRRDEKLVRDSDRLR